MAFDSLSDYYQHAGIKKPEPRKRTKARKDRLKSKDVAAVREYVFGRERQVCRCCRIRSAQSMHELLFRSLGGKVSRKNSVAVCGDGVSGCHGLLQRLEVGWEADPDFGAEGILLFKPHSRAAEDWLRLQPFECIESRPMREMETAE